VTLTTYPYLSPEVKERLESRDIHLLPIWAMIACYRVNFSFFTFTFTSITFQKIVIFTVTVMTASILKTVKHHL